LALPRATLAATAAAATARAAQVAAAEAAARAKAGGSAREELRPAVVAAGAGASLWGVRFEGAPFAAAVVAAVEPGSPAASAGVEAGWLVEAVGGSPLGDPRWPRTGGASGAHALLDAWLQTQVTAYLVARLSKPAAAAAAAAAAGAARGSDGNGGSAGFLQVLFRTATPAAALGAANPGAAAGALRLAAALAVRVDAANHTISVRLVAEPKLQTVKVVAGQFSEEQVRGARRGRLAPV
jgi:hypothetical protein